MDSGGAQDGLDRTGWHGLVLRGEGVDRRRDHAHARAVDAVPHERRPREHDPIRLLDEWA
jgi:hypothetical protein